MTRVTLEWTSPPTTRREFAFIADGERGLATEASRRFKLCREAMSTSGLFCKELEAAELQLRGNLRQLFVQAMLVGAAAAAGRV